MQQLAWAPLQGLSSDYVDAKGRLRPLLICSVGSVDPGESLGPRGQKIQLLLPSEDRTADLEDSVLTVIFLVAVTKKQLVKNEPKEAFRGPGLALPSSCLLAGLA